MSQVAARVKRFVAFSADPVTVARNLLGQRLVRVLDGRRLAGVIVEVEAYLGTRDRIANWNPAVVDHKALWNVDSLWELTAD